MPRTSAKATTRSRSSVSKSNSSRKSTRKKTTASAKNVFAKKTSAKKVSAKKRTRPSAGSLRATQSRSSRSHDNEARAISGGYGRGGSYDEDRNYGAPPGIQGRYMKEDDGHYSRLSDRYGHDQESRFMGRQGNRSRGGYEEEHEDRYSHNSPSRARGRQRQYNYSQRDYEGYGRDRY